MAKYKKELAKRVKVEDKSLTIKELKTKKRGRLCLLGKELDRQLQEYIKSLREAKAVINTTIVIATAEGIVKCYNSDLLESNGGHIRCTKHWAQHFLSRLGHVK